MSFEIDEDLVALQKYKATSIKELRIIKEQRDKTFRPFNKLVFKYVSHLDTLNVPIGFFRNPPEYLGDGFIYLDKYAISCTFDSLRIHKLNFKKIPFFPAYIASTTKIYEAMVDFEEVPIIFKFDPTFDYESLYCYAKEELKIRLAKELYSEDAEIEEHKLYNFD